MGLNPEQTFLPVTDKSYLRGIALAVQHSAKPG